MDCNVQLAKKKKRDKKKIDRIKEAEERQEET